MFPDLKPPRSWPSHIQYLDSPRYNSSIPSAVLSSIQGSTSRGRHPDPYSRRAHPLHIIRPISTSSHPAFGQRGLFASKKIPPRTHIIDYIGEVHCDDRPDSDYDISLHRFSDGTNVGSDAGRMGN